MPDPSATGRSTPVAPTAPPLVDGDLPPGWRWDERASMERHWPDGRLERIVYFDAVKCLCDVGWTVDEGWHDDDWARGLKERTPHDGLIPCGACNFAGWDAPWPVDVLPTGGAE